MPVHSHIQIPNAVLKHFRGTSGSVCYLDLDENRIRKITSTRLGTEFGYYSEDMEQFLGKEIESPLAKLASRVEAFCSGEKDSITLKPEDEKALRNYVAASIARSTLAMQVFFANSYTSDLFSKQANHDDFVLFATIILKKEFVLTDFQLVILLNRSCRPFVIPRNCFYTNKSEGHECIIAPIFPSCALGLFPSEYFSIEPAPANERFRVINNPDDIGHLNCQALRFEYTFNKSFVASNCIEELRILKRFVDKEKTHLDAQRGKLLSSL